MRRRVAPRGQSLVEFAIVLPLLLLVVFAFVELLLGLRTQGALASVAATAVHQAALAGGETAALDQEIADLAAQNGLDPGMLRLQIATDGGAGAWHPAAGHDASDDASASHPPRASYNGDVTVRLLYTDPLALPFVPVHSWTI